MEREIIRVEPIDSNFERWGAPRNCVAVSATWDSSVP
jgi:hypothetical protein